MNSTRKNLEDIVMLVAAIQDSIISIKIRLDELELIVK